MSDSFKNQFSKIEKIKFHDTFIEVVDARPEKPRTETPIIIAPGWPTTLKNYEVLIKALYQTKRRVLSLSHPRSSVNVKSRNDYPLAEERKALALLKLIDQKGLNQVDIVAHSEGVIYSTIAASFEPQKFRTLILINPAGMIGKDLFLRLAMGYLTASILDTSYMLLTIKPQKLLSLYPQECIKYIISNPVLALKEAIACSKIQLHETVRILQRQGIRTALIHTKHDRVFPIDRVKKYAKQAQINEVYFLEGNHIELLLSPEKFGKLIDQILVTLEK